MVFDFDKFVIQAQYSYDIDIIEGEINIEEECLIFSYIILKK